MVVKLLVILCFFFFFQAEDGIRDAQESRGLGDVYKRQMLELLINKDEWESLPRHLQVIIETASKAVNQDILDEYTARNNKALRELVDIHGVELRKLPDDVIAEFKIIANDILEENAASDEMVKKVYESYLSFKNEVSAYHKVSEDAFVEARNN